MHEYFRLLVVENKVVDYQYFIDEMSQYEIFDFIEVLPWANKTSYEQMRFIMWAQLKPYLKKQQITPEKMLPLYTDVDINVEKEKPLEELEIIQMRELILKQWTGK